MSLTNRERLKTLSEVIEAHNKAGTQEFEHASKLEAERAKTFAKIIQEERLLAGKWTFYAPTQWVTLEAVETWDEFPGLRDLLNPDYHDNYFLWGENSSLTLRFDDGTMTLRIPQDEVSQFVKDHGITVELTTLTVRRDALADQLCTANKLLAEMKAIVGEPTLRRHRRRTIKPPREF